MTDFEDAIAQAQAAARAAEAQAETLYEAGYESMPSLDEPAPPPPETYSYEQREWDETSMNDAQEAVREAVHEAHALYEQGYSEVPADHYLHPDQQEAASAPSWDEDALWDYAVQQGLLFVVGQVVTYAFGKVMGGLWQIAFQMESDQPKVADTGITLYGFQAHCDAAHPSGERWVGPPRRSEASAKEDLEAHERADMHLDTASPEGAGGSYQ